MILLAERQTVEKLRKKIENMCSCCCVVFQSHKQNYLAYCYRSTEGCKQVVWTTHRHRKNHSYERV